MSRKFQLRFGVAQFFDYDPLAEIDQLERWGFDYCEPALSQVMALDGQDFNAALKKIESGGVRVEAANAFLPAGRKIVGLDVDSATLESYVSRALARAAALGAKVVVFGSGEARRVPDGFPRETAWRQLIHFLQRGGDEIERQQYDMVIGIEALRRAESNIVNTTAEAYDLARAANHARVRVICDLFHLAAEREDPSILLKVDDYLVHVHLSNPVGGRSFPRTVNECPDYAPFFDALRTIGYNGRLSLEAYTQDFHTDVPAGLAAVRELYRLTSI